MPKQGSGRAPYIGFHLGYGRGEADFNDSSYNGGFAHFPVLRWETTARGGLAGVQAGYNWQRDDWVFGLEAELGYLDLHGKRFQPGLDPDGKPYDAAGHVDANWYAGLVGRLGYAFDRTLVYAKAGAVYSHAQLSYRDTCVTAPCGNTVISASDRVGWGYQLGAGVEHAVDERWTVRAEYAWFDFGSKHMDGVGIDGVSNGVYHRFRADLTAHTLKLGVNYRF